MDAEFVVKNQTLKTLYLIFACFQPLAFIAGFFALTMAMAGTFAAQRHNDPILRWYTFLALVGVIFMVLSVILFVAAFVASEGIRKRKRYGRIWGIIVATLALLEIPIGTALGIYALRFFTSERGKQLYLNL